MNKSKFGPIETSSGQFVHQNKLFFLFPIAVVETVPFVVILVIGNIAIQLIYHLGSILEGLIGIFMPNGYLKVR